ncbi:vomeronasal type-1 receptor [Cricetulus griseus]|nr:vomeronasal type-1 receptor [Cricetulus griseus]
MLILLCRHKKQSQHLHSTSLSPKAPPEQRATRSILLLVGFFVLMSILDSIISCLRTMFLNDPTSYYIQLFVVHIYATVSPFVFMSTENHIGVTWDAVSVTQVSTETPVSRVGADTIRFRAAPNAENTWREDAVREAQLWKRGAFNQAHLHTRPPSYTSLLGSSFQKEGTGQAFSASNEMIVVSVCESNYVVS